MIEEIWKVVLSFLNSDPRYPLLASFLLGFLSGSLLFWIFAYRRYRKVRRSRYLRKLDNLQETARMEKENY